MYTLLSLGELGDLRDNQMVSMSPRRHPERMYWIEVRELWFSVVESQNTGLKSIPMGSLQCTVLEISA